MNETKDDLKREKVRIVPISNIEDFPDHPFQVKDDESMDALVESIRMNGVLNPVIALKIDENHYQLISGHRRKHACVLLGIDRIPLIGREMTKEEAVIEMVDSNLQREHILPSEKARAYKMKMDAMKKQGERRDLTSNPVGGKLKGIETAEIIGDEAGESANQVRRYIRLNELTDELLEFVDEGKIGMRPAVELKNSIYEEWCDTLIACQNDRTLKDTLMPVVSKLTDVRLVNNSLKTMLAETRREYWMMVLMVVGNVPLLYCLNRDWYDALMNTVFGKIVLAISGVVIIITAIRMNKITKPIEYKR